MRKSGVSFVMIYFCVCRTCIHIDIYWGKRRRSVVCIIDYYGKLRRRIVLFFMWMRYIGVLSYFNFNVINIGWVLALLIWIIIMGEELLVLIVVLLNRSVGRDEETALQTVSCFLIIVNNSYLFYYHNWLYI